MRRLLIAAALLLASAAALSNDVPTAWPRLDLRNASAAIVVANVARGGELPMLDECRKEQVICLHGPFWFHADIRAVVSGKVAETSLEVATMSHYGVDWFVRDPEPRLLSLRAMGGQVVMPTYAYRTLVARRDGEWFLVDSGDEWPDWLPCAMAPLREPLAVADFASDLRIAPEAYESRQVDERRDLYQVTPAGAYPRFGISVNRLRQLIATLKARGAPTDCQRPGKPD